MLKTFIIPKPTTLPDNKSWYVIGCDDLISNWPVFNEVTLNNYTIGNIYTFVLPKNINIESPHCLDNYISYQVFEQPVYKNTVVSYDGHNGIPFKLNLNAVDFNTEKVCVLFQGRVSTRIDNIYVPELDSQIYYFTELNQLSGYDTDETFTEFTTVGNIPFWLGGSYYYYSSIISKDDIDPTNNTIIAHITGEIGQKNIIDYCMDDNADYYTVPCSCTEYDSDSYRVEIRVPYELNVEYGLPDSLDYQIYYTTGIHNCDESTSQEGTYETYNMHIDAENIVNVSGNVPVMVPDSIGGIEDIYG